VITYSATLDVPEETATLVTDLLIAERRRRRTGIGARAASARDQAVLVLRWFRQDTGMPNLARDARVSTATGYRYLHEGIDVLAAAAPDLHAVLEAGKAAGWTHVTVDGTLIRTDRCRMKNPGTGHDLWYSGKHGEHGGNVQVVCDPEGFPAAVSDVQPGSVHDLAAARMTGFRGALHAAAALLGLPALADKGYDGGGILTPTKGRHLHPDNAVRNELIGCYALKANAASPCSRPAGRLSTASDSALSESVPSPPQHSSSPPLNDQSVEKTSLDAGELSEVAAASSVVAAPGLSGRYPLPDVRGDLSGDPPAERRPGAAVRRRRLGAEAVRNGGRAAAGCPRDRCDAGRRRS
jgi:hypothetical protein